MNGLSKLNGLAGPHPPFNRKVLTEEIFLDPSLRNYCRESDSDVTGWELSVPNDVMPRVG